MKNLYKKVSFQSSLRAAWRSVRDNGMKSYDPRTVNEIRTFEEEIDKNINRIYRKLLGKKYKFQPARGFTFTRPGKSDRPIVVASVEDRVVQRSILEILNEQDFIKNDVNHPFSFGGLRKKGVEQAIRQACKAVRNGAKYYIRSDIPDFFRNIPRFSVLKIISDSLADDSLNDLLEKATRVELKNVELMESNYRGLFPKYDLGVGQGFCLSPLFGNILLLEFDQTVNREDVVCLRYIDDFIILGPDNKTVHSAFKAGLKVLKKNKLAAYQPLLNKDKACEGTTSKSFDFLGCSISPDFVHPNSKARNRLLEKVDNILDRSKKEFFRCKKNDKSFKVDYSLVSTLKMLHDTLRAWGNHYKFCNSNHIFANLDKKIDEKIREYIRTYDALKNNLDKFGKRKLLGVHLLTQSTSKPILPLKEQDKLKKEDNFSSMIEKMMTGYNIEQDRMNFGD